MTPPVRNTSKKLKEFLSKYFAPEHLNPELKQTLLMQLAYSIQAFPAGYWEQFELIDRLVKILITKKFLMSSWRKEKIYLEMHY